MPITPTVTPITVLIISLFGLLGILARFLTNLTFSRFLSPTDFPTSTFTINLIGSFIIGAVYVAAIEKELLSNDLRLGLMIGLLGGFTTFSAFSLETLNLFESGRHLVAVSYFIGSPVLGLVCAFAGATTCRMIIAS